MILKHASADVDPKKLNTWLGLHGGYTASGAIYWAKAADYDGSGGVIYRGSNNTWNNWNELSSQLSQGRLVIVKVDAYLSTPQLEPHWVLVTEKIASSTSDPYSYSINDPWDLTYTPKTLGYYYDTVYHNTFFAMRYYSGPFSSVAPPSPPTPTSPGTSSGPGPVIDNLTPTLRWNESSGADHYALAISKYPYGSSNIVYNPQVLYGTSVTVPSGKLEYGQKYRWNMQAINSAGPSGVSNTLYFQTPLPTPTLRIDGGTTSRKQQGETFHFTGSNFTPNATAQQHIIKPNGQDIGGSIQVFSDSTLSWEFHSDCSTDVGTYDIWVTDPQRGNSNHVAEIIDSNPACSPVLCKDTDSLNFGTTATNKTFGVWNCGGGTLSYSISDNQAGISVNPTSGSSTGEHDTITVTVNRSGLSPDHYTGTITINPNYGSNQYVSVSMDVPETDPALCRSPSGLDFGTTSTSKTFGVWNCGGGTLSYSISDNQAWISVNPTSGSSTGEHDTITVTVNRSGLSPGHYTGTVTINPNYGSNQYVNVSMDVPAPDPVLCKDKSDLDFGTTSTSKTFEVWNCGGGTLSYTISDNGAWISVSPTSGSSTGEHDTITVTVDRSGLSPGHYTGTVTIDPNYGANQSVSVSMDVPETDPALCRSPSSLDFGTSSTSKAFEVWNCGGGTLTYTISDDKAWISVSPTSGSSTGEHDTITVTVDRSGLSPGHYTGTVTIDPNYGANQSVSVSMDVPETDPALCRSPSSLDFGTSSTSKTFGVWNCGGGTLSYTISDNRPWIRVSPSSGSSTGEHDTITVTVDRSELSPGPHSGTVTIDPSHGSDQTVSVELDGLQFNTNTVSLTVPEGGTATFQVKLSAQPSGTVQATVSRVSGDSNINVTGGSNLTFTTSNWNTYQTVTLAAAEDADTTNGSATIRIHRTSGDAVPDKDVQATEQDNDALQFVTDKDAVPVPEGGTATFQVKLSAQPSGTVQATVSRASGDSDISVTGGSNLTFTTSNWNTYQTVTLAAAEDADTTNGSATIRIHRTSGDAVPDKDVQATEQDNDALQFVTDKDAVPMPEGGTATFQVKLSSQPSGTVQATVSRVSGDSDISVTGGSNLTFTTSNWNTYQTVTLAAAEDADTTNGSATIRIHRTSGDSVPDKDMTATENDGNEQRQCIPLAASWNFISLGLEPDNPSPQAVFDEVAGTLYLWNWDANTEAWKTVINGLLTQVGALGGYWIWLPQGLTVCVEGTPLTGDHTLTLGPAGWQQIGVPYDVAWGTGDGGSIMVEHAGEVKSLAEAVAAGWIFNTIWEWDSLSEAWIKPTVLTGATLDPWTGYWIYTFRDGLVLHFSPAGPGEPPPPTTMAVKTTVPAAPPKPQEPSPELLALKVINDPNPIYDVHTTTFRVLGVCPCSIQALRIRVYDLAGRLVWEGEDATASLTWRTQNMLGEYLSNGVYLYQAQVKISGEWVTTPLEKLAVLR